MNEEQQKTDIAAAVSATNGFQQEMGGAIAREEAGFMQRLLENNPVNHPGEQAMTPDMAAELEELQFQFHMARVNESRQKHIDFVRRYLGKDYQAKFADVRAEKSYFVGFLKDPKRRSAVAIPPINMSGTVENVRPNRMYMCSGYEARMFERILATKNIEALNMTPSTEGIAVSMVEIIQKWKHPQTVDELQLAALKGPDSIAKPRKPFGNYVDHSEGPDLATEVVAEERPTLGEMHPELAAEVWDPIMKKDDEEFQKGVQSFANAIGIPRKMLERPDPINDAPENGTEPDSDYTDQVQP